MRIGIDCRTILNPESGERAGVGYYTYSLVRALLDLDHDNHYILFFDYRTKREAAQTFDQENVTIKFLPFSGYGKFLPFGYSHLLVAAAFAKQKLDVLHGPANIVPLGFRWPTVITLHDLAIYRHPEWFPTRVFSTRLLVPQSLKHANQIIAVSQSSKHDAQELFNIPDEKITVIPEAANVGMLNLRDKDQDVERIYKLPKKYVLYVGTIEPRKNLPVLFKAWEQILRHRPEIMNGTQLILGGGVGHGGEDILPLIKKMKLTKSIRHLGYLSHNHKIMLMKDAQAFVFPTLYEGFGLPVLEAMQLGVPVISTKTSSIPEVTGDAALLVEPNDVEGLAEAMQKVLSDGELRKSMSAKGKAQAAKFSWEKTAKQTLAVYNNVVKPKKEKKKNT